MPIQAGLSSRERELIDHIAANERTTVTADEVAALREVDRRTANQVLVRLQAKGWLRRVKRGVYTPVPLGSATAEPVVEDPWALAMKLFEPCYVSGWSAAEHWDLTEQIFNTVAIVTGTPQRRAVQEYAGVRFRVRAVESRRLFGTTKIWIRSQTILIADPSRLLIDMLDAPEFGGGARHTIDVVRAYWASQHANPEQLLHYAQQYDRGTVFKRLGFLAEAFHGVDDDWLERCASRVSAGVSALDPSGPHHGAVARRWNLRINVPVGDP
jgi:predicted transcriptional regulator of viral defense system